jgi:hypothetical protein
MPAAQQAEASEASQIQTWLDANEQQWFIFCQEEGQLKEFHCPLTGVPMSDPVKAEDGYSYNRVNLEEWIANLSNNGHQVISPMSGEVMGSSFKDNDAKRQALLRVIGVLTRLQEKEESNADGIEDWQTVNLDNEDSRQVTLTMTSGEVARRAVVRQETLSELRDAHLALEPIRKSLGGVLDPEDWKPPNVTAVGTRSAGKSTILERLVHLPLFPRAPSICNKMPFHVLLRQSSMAEAKATICVKDVNTGELIGEVTPIPVQNGVLHVNKVQVSEHSAVTPLFFGSHGRCLFFIVLKLCFVPTFLSRNAFYRRTLPTISAPTRRSCSKCITPTFRPSILSTCLGWRRTKNMELVPQERSSIIRCGWTETT